MDRCDHHGGDPSEQAGPEGFRRPVPHERPVPLDRRCASPQRHGVYPGGRRGVLSPEGDQGRPRVPSRARESARRREPPAGGQRPRPRDRRHFNREDPSLRPAALAVVVRGAWRVRSRDGARGTLAQACAAVSRAADEVSRPSHEHVRLRARPLPDRRAGIPGGAEGREHAGIPRPPREYHRACIGPLGVLRQPSRGYAGGVSGGSLAGGRRRHGGFRPQRGDAHDGPRRERARVSCGVCVRAGRGAVPHRRRAGGPEGA